MRNRAKILAAVVPLVLLGACGSQADVVSQNVSRDADEFKVDRRIVALNLITDKYLFEVRGKCSIKADTEQNQIEITCKIGPDAYQKHFVGYTAGANVVYTVEQLQTSNVDSYRYSIIFRPEQIVPIVIA